MAVIIRDRAATRLRAERSPIGRRSENMLPPGRGARAEAGAASIPALTRRRFLATIASSAAIAGIDAIAKPHLSRASDRPAVTHGVQSGDVSTNSGIVWARTDRPARMLVEAATTDSFKTIHSAVSVDAFPESDFTAKALLEGLPSGQDVFYRIRFQDHSFPDVLGEPQVGHFRTAPSDLRSISFAWSGDTAGWGIDEARGGMRTYATMARSRPDFFIHSGDHIYADCPIPDAARASQRRDLEERRHRGEIPRRPDACGLPRQLQVQPARPQPARVQRRGPDVRAMGRSRGHQRLVPGGAAAPRRLRRQQHPEARRARLPRLPRVHADAPDASRSRPHLSRIPYGPLLDVFMLDMRSYRSAVGEDGAAAAILGPTQVAWLERELINSQATWKIIAADLPIGVVSGDAIAQGDGPARGREIEIAGLLAFIKRAGIRNTVWITADMHYTAAHYYDPNTAVFQDFEPFWEFVSGPIHAGTWQPQQLDDTFGPRALFQKGCSGDQRNDLAPCFGLQFFGHVAIDGTTRVMTVTLKDVEDRALWAVEIAPRIERWSSGLSSIRG